MDIAFVDTETTGLDPDRHEIWEVAAIIDDQEHHWFLPIRDEAHADLHALNIGGYFERHPSQIDRKSKRLKVTRREAFCQRFQELTRGKHLCGAGINFDDKRLEKLLRANGYCPAWDHRLIDIRCIAAGYLMNAGRQIPDWRSDHLADAVGVEKPSKAERHTAMGDARFVKRIWEHVSDRIWEQQPQEAVAS